jgi:hypothetical protein
MKRFMTMSIVLALASCTEQPPEPRTSSETSEIGNLNTTCGCDAVFPTQWNGSITDYWYGNAQNMVLILSGNSGDNVHPNTFLAFGFAGNGYQLAWTYRVNLADYESFQQKWIHAYKIKHDAEPDTWIGGGGGLDGVGPGPIGPGGIPPFFVARMQRTAGVMIDQIRINNASGVNGAVVIGPS